MSFWRCFGIVTIFLGSVAGWAQDSFDTPLAIVHVTAVPTPGEGIADATILIEDGRIVRVGAGIRIPDDAQVFDGSGLFAYAGFIDAATHIGMKEKKPTEEMLNRVKDNEYPVVEGPRTHMEQANRLGVWPHLGVTDFYIKEEHALDPWRKAGFTTALVTPHPDIVSGSGDVLQLSDVALRRATLAPGVTQILGFGDLEEVDYREGREYPASPMGAVAMIRQLYMDAEWYRARHAQFAKHPTELKRMAFDPVLDAMGPLLEREQMWLFAVNTPNEIHHAIDLSEELNQRVTILGGKEAWKVAERLASSKVPVIVSLDFEEKPLLTPKAPEKTVEYATATWTPQFEEEFFEPLEVRRDRVRAWEAQVNNLHALMAAGVPVGITSRDLEGPDKLAESFKAALELALTPEELLTALTVSPAKILGVDRQLGTIEPGKIANLTLLTAPLGDEKSRVRHVFIDGERFTQTVGLEKENGDKDKEADKEDDKDKDKDEEDVEDSYAWEAELPSDREIDVTTGGDVLLANARVIDVVDGSYRVADVLVRSGIIRKIESGLVAPSGVTTIDLSGYWLMPGVVDPHSHIAVTDVNEWTQSISSECRQADVIDHTALSIHRALAGGVTTIHTMHGSANSMGGQNVVLKLKYDSSPAEMRVTSGPRIVKFALGENVTRARPIPRFPNSRMGVESVFRHAFTEAGKYAAEWEVYNGRSRGSVLEIPRRDLRLEAILDILRGNIWVHSHCYRGDEILRLIAVAEDFGFRIATFQHVLEGYRVAPEMYAHGAAGSTFSDWWSYKKEAYDAIPHNAAMMANAGILTSLNSDDPELMRRMTSEAGKTLRFGGLDAAEAMRLITINPAIQLGLEDRIGSIEVGKDGDFAVFSKHPLDTHARNVLTLIEGEILFQEPGLALDGSTPGPGSEFVPSPPRELLPVPADTGFHAITGATIHPITSEPIENGTLVIRDGRIAAMTTGKGIPQGATVVDASGLHVYPGIVNAATQMGLAEIEGIAQTVDHTDLASIQPELRALSGVNPHSEHLPVSLCEGVTVSHVIPLGGMISGRASAIQMMGWTLPELLRNEETGLAVSLPLLPTKAELAKLEEEERTKKLAEHERAYKTIEEFMRNARHYAKLAGADAGHAANLRLEAMLPYVRGEKPVYFHAQSLKAIRQALTFAEAFELSAVIVGGRDAWKVADELAEKDVAVIVDSVTDLPLSRHEDSYERYNAYFENPKRLHEAGVTFAIASNGTEHAKKAAINAGFAIAHGLDPLIALRAVTIDAAAIMGLDSEIGSLEEGKIADVIVTTGDPTQTSTRTVAAFVNGRPATLDSLHERNYQKFNARPNPELEAVEELRGPPAMRSPLEVGEDAMDPAKVTQKR